MIYWILEHLFPCINSFPLSLAKPFVFLRGSFQPRWRVSNVGNKGPCPSYLVLLDHSDVAQCKHITGEETDFSESYQRHSYGRGFEYSLKKSEHDCACQGIKETSEKESNLCNNLPACRMEKLVPL